MKTYNAYREALVKYRPLSFDSLKDQLTGELFEELDVNPEAHPAIVRAANSAALVAWETPYPFLFLPTLLEEGVQEALRQESRKPVAGAWQEQMMSLVA